MNGNEPRRAGNGGLPSLGETLSDLSRNALILLEGQTRMATGEVSRKVTAVRKDSQLVAAGAFVAYAGFFFILGAVVMALSLVIPLVWATLIVGVATVAAGAVTISVGRKRLGGRDFLPRETYKNIKEDAKWMRDQLM